MKIIEDGGSGGIWMGDWVRVAMRRCRAEGASLPLSRAYLWALKACWVTKRATAARGGKRKQGERSGEQDKGILYADSLRGEAWRGSARWRGRGRGRQYGPTMYVAGLGRCHGRGASAALWSGPGVSGRTAGLLCRASRA